MIIVSLNDMSVKTADIMKAYTKVSRRDNVYPILAPEFGIGEVKMKLMV